MPKLLSPATGAFFLVCPAGRIQLRVKVPYAPDRLVQQAVHQILSPLFDPEFSDFSYGFRPGRSAHDAVLKAREFQRAGKRRVVDMDLKTLSISDLSSRNFFVTGVAEMSVVSSAKP